MHYDTTAILHDTINSYAQNHSWYKSLNCTEVSALLQYVSVEGSVTSVYDYVS